MNHLSFCDFVAKVLKVELTPAQHALASVAFDGLEPIDLSDRALARALFGEADRIPIEARGVLVAVCGARAGKSYVLGALYSLWRALVADISGLAPGEQATALIVGPDMRLARQVLRYALGAAEGCHPIKSLIEGQGADVFCSGARMGVGSRLSVCRLLGAAPPYVGGRSYRRCSMSARSSEQTITSSMTGTYLGL